MSAALAQTYDNIEVVVSDNASTDETAGVLKECNDPRLRVIRQQTNLGPVPNWNTCLDHAKGVYIVFVPDDDRIEPWFLEHCVALIVREPQIQLVIALCGENSVADGRRWYPAPNRRLKTGIWEGTDILREYLEGWIGSRICTTVIRTETLRAGGGFPNDWPYAGDIASWIPSLLKGKAGFVNEQCGYTNVHAATQTSMFSVDVRLRDIQKIVDLISDTVDQTIADPKKSDEIKGLARRWFGLCAFYLLTLRKNEGARLTDLLPVIWRWRQGFAQFGVSDAYLLAGPLATILLPKGVMDRLRYIKRMPAAAVDKLHPFWR